MKTKRRSTPKTDMPKKGKETVQQETNEQETSSRSMDEIKPETGTLPDGTPPH